jgi:two-component system chemotaxis response regulator CheY
MRKVIVVDDSKTARTQVRSALEGAGFDIVEACDGRDGIAKIEENADASLVLCDVNMPNLNGLDMLDAIPASTRGRLTVLMLTTEAEPKLVQRAKSLGAKGWIVKPFKPDLLLGAVKKLAG